MPNLAAPASPPARSPLAGSLRLAVALGLASLGAGCERAGSADTAGPHAPAPASAPAHDEHAELAPFMGSLQRFSQKLGYAIDGQSPRLAGFYLTEIEETLEEVEEEIPVHEGLDLAQLIRTIAEPATAAMRDALGAEPDWEKARERYAALIDACNRCHAAAEHEYIVILPASGPIPFNQRFDVK